MSADPREAEHEVPGRVRRPPAPGEISAGPALTELVVETRRAAVAIEQLTRAARAEAHVREYQLRGSFNTDANGDGGARLFEVPQGATGYLVWLALDQVGVSPAGPDTSADLWHALYSGAGASAAAVIAVGNLLDCQPLTPAADAQIPYVYSYGSRESAPTLIGPEAFWIVVDGATASRTHGYRGKVIVLQPEP